MDLNHTEKNILIISCLSSTADADICMCLLVELCGHKEWELNIFFFPFYLNSFCSRSSVNMCWARQAGQARGKAQGLLFNSPLCVCILERLLTDRLTDLMYEVQDCPSPLQPPGWQCLNAEISQLCLNFSPAESWTLFSDCAQQVPLYFVPSKSDPTSNFH